MYRFIIKKIKRRLVSSLLKTVNNKLSNNPLDSDALNNRAILNIGQDTLEQSLQDMNNAIEISANHHPLLHYECSAAHLFRGYIYIQLNKKDLAKKEFKESIFQDHENKDAKIASKSLSKPFSVTKKVEYISKLFSEYINKNYAKRIKVLENLCANEEANKTTRYDLSVYYFLSNKYDQSLLHAKQSLNIDQNNGSACLLIGIINFLQGDNNSALSYIDQAIEIFKTHHHDYHINSSVQYYNRGFIYYNMNELDIACNDLTKSLDLHKKNIDALILRAKIYLKKGLVNEAISDLQAATKYENNMEAKRLLKKLNVTTS